MSKDRSFALAILVAVGVVALEYAAFGPIRPGFVLESMAAGASTYLIATARQ